MTGNDTRLAVERAIGILVGVASRRGTITYTDLAKMLGMSIESPADRAKLGVILGDVASLGFAEWGVLLPAIAVGKGENMPSGRRPDDSKGPSGFYAWCLENGFAIGDNPWWFVVQHQAKVYRTFAGA
jgi:hypothetical protein